MNYHDNIDSVFFSNEPLLTSQNLIENDINDLFLNEEDNKRYYIHNESISQDINMKQIMVRNYIYDNRTSDITDKRRKYLLKNDNVPPFYSLNTISGILIQNDINYYRIIDRIINTAPKVIEAEEYMKSTKKKSIDNLMYKNDYNYNFNFNQENLFDFEYKEVKEKDNYHF